MSEAKRLSDREIKIGQVVFASIVGGLTVILFWFTPILISNYRADTPFQLSPAFYPELALGVAALGAVGHIFHIRSGQQQLEESDEFEVGEFFWLLVLAGGSLFFAYALLVPLVGYAVATLLFMFVACRLSGISILFSLLFSVTTATSLYALFVILLKVWFPAPALLRAFGLL